VKIVSFCLWGSDPKYTVGALRNAELAKTVYPGWKCRFYCGSDVPNMIIFNLELFDNVELIHMNRPGDWTSMLWRAHPAAEEDVEVVISRDTDSRLNMREKEAVDVWLASEQGFHIMRDHPHHRYPVLGGMWGAKKGTVPLMKQLIEEFGGTDQYGTDYIFFQKKVLPTLREDQILVHDEFFGGLTFPTSRKGDQFVGQVFDADENTIPEHTQILREALK